MTKSPFAAMVVATSILSTVALAQASSAGHVLNARAEARQHHRTVSAPDYGVNAADTQQYGDNARQPWWRSEGGGMHPDDWRQEGNGN
jgi:hypothetical protein